MMGVFTAFYPKLGFFDEKHINSTKMYLSSKGTVFFFREKLNFWAKIE